MRDRNLGRRQFMGGVAASSLVGIGGCLESGYHPFTAKDYAIQIEQGGLIESIELLSLKRPVLPPDLKAADIEFQELDQDIVLKVTFDHSWGGTETETHYIDAGVSVARIEEDGDDANWSLPLTFEAQSLEGDLLARAVAVEYDSHVTPGGPDEQ